MQPLKLSPFQVFWRSILMLIQAAPKEIRSLTLLTLLGGISPPLVLFFNKIIIDEVSHLLSLEVKPNLLDFVEQEPLLWGSIGGLILLNWLSDSIPSITNFWLSSLRDRVEGFVQVKVFQKIAYFEDIALFETPELLNLIQLTELGIQRFQQLSFLLMTTLNGFFIFVPSFFLSSLLAWWIPLILFTVTAPSVYVDLKYQKASWIVEKTQASVNRKMNLYKEVLIHEAYAKELRLLNLQSFFMERWQNLFQVKFQAMQQIRRRGKLAVMAWSIVSVLGMVLPYIYVVLGAIKGNYSLGDLAFYAGLILQVRQSLFLLINNSADLYDIILGISPIFRIFALKSNLFLSSLRGLDKENCLSNHQNKHQARHQQQGIEIKNVSFSYPGKKGKF